MGERDGILWLAPIERRFWLDSLQGIEATRRLEAAGTIPIDRCVDQYDFVATVDVLRNEDPDWVPCHMIRRNVP